MKIVSPALVLAAASLLAHPVHAEEKTMDRLSLITGRAFDVRILANGRDVTASSPIATAKYNADGTGTRTLRDGTRVSGHWRFLNAQQTQIEVQGPEGSSRWVIIELNDRIYRKANIDTGVEFIQLPKAP